MSRLSSIVPASAGVFLAVLALAGCSSSERKAFESSSSSGGFVSKDAGANDLPGADGCTAAARLVYVVSQENELYAFTPNTLTFSRVGVLQCPTTGLSTPNSMAIDRGGTAWVNYSDGSLFKVSTLDASCAATSFEPNQASFAKFGMAFSTNSTDGVAETLFISGLTAEGTSGKGLGTIDLSTMKLTMLGDYSGNLSGQGAELTGTGDGRLFGFFTTSPATLAEIDKTKGATSNSRSLDGVSTGNAWAFSFWGGDFWFYTSDGVSPSRVTQLKTSGDGSIVVAKEDVGGFKIVGAGVSTCAPTTPTK
jgi:hypothetical protein